jgi:hypothetical protein
MSEHIVCAGITGGIIQNTSGDDENNGQHGTDLCSENCWPEIEKVMMRSQCGIILVG